MSVISVKTRLYWTLFLSLALLAGILAIKSYFVVSPGLTVDIRFSRTEAIAAADAFQREYFPRLITTRRAITFVSDRYLQNYVELEGGGLASYQVLIPQVDAATHYWSLRSFAEGQQEELMLAFNPQGKFISFNLVVSDETPGAALTEEAARELAETNARQHLGERFDAYQPLETRVVHQPTGRADYSFTYEHSSLQVAEARFRLTLKVAGDQVVTLNTFKFIPDGFNQRFDEMRALNHQISQVANYLMLTIMVLGGLLGGGIWLFRRHELHWRPALVPALVVSTGLAAAVLSNLPAAWMSYQTTNTVNNFLFQQGFQAVLVFVVLGLGLSIVYAIAEGLTRMAFAQHPRIYDAWRVPVAGSPEVVGRIFGGYAWAGSFLAYAVLFMLLASRVLGWWSPTGMSSDPNILSSWRPALAPIFMALQAGTWEECLFRAIPLSVAVLLGRHFKMMKSLVFTTLILQALIFAGAHADYPQLPGYSRLLELFIPALVFGIVFLRFGLIPCMLAHFIYDLVLMSVPIFTATDASLWLDRGLVISVGVLPLVVLAYAYWRQGGWQSLAAQWRNGVTAPPMPLVGTEVSRSMSDPGSSMSDPSLLRPLALSPQWLIGIVVVAVAVLTFSVLKPKDIIWPHYQIDRAQAIQIAEAELQKHGVKLTGEWRKTALTNNGFAGQNQFVWRESGRADYQQLIGNYLDTPYWAVTWRRFDGPVAERAEYWAVWLSPDGSLHELVHSLPEAAPGAQLNRAEAVALARAWLIDLGWPDSQTLEEKAVEEIKRPARTDWSIRYIDKSGYDHNNGQAIIRVALSGDEVTGYVRAIDVPQEWYRAEERQAAAFTVYRIASFVAAMLLVVMGFCGFFGRATGQRFRFDVALPWILINSLCMPLASVLMFDQMAGQFATSMAWSTQLILWLVGLGVGALILGLISFFAAQVIYAPHQRLTEPENSFALVKRDFILGSSLGLGLIALSIGVSLLMPPSLEAPGAYLANYAALWPWLATISNGLTGFLMVLIKLVLVVGLLRFATKSWRKITVLVCLVIFLVSSMLGAKEPSIMLLNNVVILLGILLLLELLRRKQMAVAIAFAGAGLALSQLGIGQAVYPGAWLHGLVSMLVCWAITYGLVWHWYRYTAVAPVVVSKEE